MYWGFLGEVCTEDCFHFVAGTIRYLLSCTHKNENDPSSKEWVFPYYNCQGIGREVSPQTLKIRTFLCMSTWSKEPRSWEESNQSTFSFLLSDPFTGLDRGPRCSFTLFSRIRYHLLFPPAGLLLEVVEVGKCPFSFAKKAAMPTP